MQDLVSGLRAALLARTDNDNERTSPDKYVVDP
jgi:hypothetical protein